MARGAAHTLVVDGEEGGTVLLARSPLTRFFGLMGRRGVPGGHAGFLFPKCSALHTFFMRFPLDLVYLRDGHVVKVAEHVAPWRLSWGGRGVDALEVRAGEAARLGIRPGTRVEAVASDEPGATR